MGETPAAAVEGSVGDIHTDRGVPGGIRRAPQVLEEACGVAYPGACGVASLVPYAVACPVHEEAYQDRSLEERGDTLPEGAFDPQTGCLQAPQRVSVLVDLQMG